MNRFFAAGLIAAAYLLGSAAAYAADAPQAPAPANPPPAAAPAAPAAGGEWFPHFMDLCKQHGIAEADCQRSLDEKKAQLLQVCKNEGISGDENCRQWVQKRMDEARQQRLAVCKENGIEGEDACGKWIEQRRAEAMDNFQSQCKKDGLNEEQCQQRYNEMVQKWQADNQKFIADCAATGASHDDCMKKLRDKRHAEAMKNAGSPPAAAGPPAPAGAPSADKGKALPPPQ